MQDLVSPQPTEVLRVRRNESTISTTASSRKMTTDAARSCCFRSAAFCLTSSEHQQQPGNPKLAGFRTGLFRRGTSSSNGVQTLQVVAGNPDLREEIPISVSGKYQLGLLAVSPIPRGIWLWETFIS
jgi:hypothetical protein